MYIKVGKTMQEYKTVNGSYTAEYIEKRSRFIAVCFHCESENQANQIIAEQKSIYWDARHNVYAYLLKDGTARFSDDGEPHGTAGMPVLEVIKGSGLTDILVVVTRYFGGTLLGTGGLVRAYSTSTRDAIDGSAKVLMCTCSCFEACCPYSDFDRLTRLIDDCGGIVKNTEFTDKVTVEFYFKNTDRDDFLNKLCETFASKISAELKEELFFPFNL